CEGGRDAPPAAVVGAGEPGGVDRLEARAAADEERRRLVHAAAGREVARGLQLGRDGASVARGEDLLDVEARDGGGDAAELPVGRPARVLGALVVVGKVGDVPELVLPARRVRGGSGAAVTL